MAEKELKGRFLQKTDTTENWGKAENFKPYKGEVVVYQDGKSSKIKIGDGATVVGELPFIAGEGGGSVVTGKTYANVSKLPEGNFDENIAYRVLEGTFVGQKRFRYDAKCHVVEVLPETGESALVQNGDDLSYVGYYNIKDNEAYAYINSDTKNLLITLIDASSLNAIAKIAAKAVVNGMATGWKTFKEFIGLVGSAVSVSWGGVVYTLGEITNENALYLFIGAKTYYRNNGVWTSGDFTIGRRGTDSDAEVFNDLNNVASAPYAHAEGSLVVASGSYSHAEGYRTEASGLGAHSEGQDTHATGGNAHAEGSGTISSGTASHTEGVNTKATTWGAHAEGGATEATNEYSHAEGYVTHATAQYAHAEGNNTMASGVAAHSEGWLTRATGQNSHAEGYNASASYYYAHAEGANTISSGEASHAEGLASEATGAYSHAEGQGSKAEAIRSHAEGHNTVAKADASHAGGKGTIAAGVAQTVIGKYNIENNSALLVVGNGTGTDNNDRDNAFVVNENGSAEVYFVDDGNPNSIVNVEYLNGRSFGVGNKTAEGGEVFNEAQEAGYGAHAENSGQAYGGNSHAEGSSRTGLNGYLIKNIVEGSYSGEYIITLDDVSNFSVRDRIGIYEEAGSSMVQVAWPRLSSVQKVNSSEKTLTVSLYSDYGTIEFGSDNQKKYITNHSNISAGKPLPIGGEYSHAEGQNTRTLHAGGHAEGISTIAAGGSHAEGASTIAGGARGYKIISHAKTDTSITFTLETIDYVQAGDLVQLIYTSPVGSINVPLTNSVLTVTSFDTANKKITTNYKHIDELQEGLEPFYLINLTRLTTGTKSCVFFQPENTSSHAEGDYTIAPGYYSHAEGVGTAAIGYSSHAEGSNTTATGFCSHASGQGTIAVADSQTVIGKYNAIDNEALFVIGNGSSDKYRGNAFVVYSDGSVTGSMHAPPRDDNFVTVGGITSVTAGKKTETNGEIFNDYVNNTAGFYAHTEGYHNTASGEVSHAEGYYTTASGMYAHAEGSQTYATGEYSHAEGFNNTSSAPYSHTEGKDNIAAGNNSHAEGRGTKAYGNESHAEGLRSQTYTNGAYGHAEGYETHAMSTASHSEGAYTRAYGAYSHAAGVHSHAYGFAQTVVGVNNAIDDKALFIVGNGSSDGSDAGRSSAFVVHPNGSVTIANSILMKDQVTGENYSISIQNGQIVCSKVTQ